MLERKEKSFHVVFHNVTKQKALTFLPSSSQVEWNACFRIVFVFYALQPDVIFGLAAGNILQHPRTTSSFSTITSCSVTAAWHLLKAPRELRETWRVCFPFPLIHTEFQLKSHTLTHIHTRKASAHLGDSDNVLWWYQIGVGDGRGLQTNTAGHACTLH